ncbi:MAG: hypothetical protein ABIF87_01280 [Pseudomonadota bacterium]
MRHKSISVDTLEPGMVLAKEIVGNKGNLIVGKGVELSDRMIAHLKRLGVKKVFIETEEEAVQMDPERAQVLIDEMEGTLNSRFRRVRDIPVMNELKNILFDHMRAKILHG